MSPKSRFASLLLLLTLVAACADNEARIAEPSPSPAFELFDGTLRVPEALINAHVYGSFAIAFEGKGPTVILKGPANFPGSPPDGPGSCQSGLWINARGKATSGSIDMPHPHCVEAPSVLEVVLEPISACYTRFPSKEPCPLKDRAAEAALVVGVIPMKEFLAPDIRIDQLFDGKTRSTTGSGFVTGYAIDASTLGTTNKRVGILSFKLEQYISDVGLFEDDCSLDETKGIPCLNQVIEAFYKPLVEDWGMGATATGFLWFTQATAPYNYHVK